MSVGVTPTASGASIIAEIHLIISRHYYIINNNKCSFLEVYNIKCSVLE